ncbi:hypothetical protein B0H14DRAFT_3152608 [Mycena olivaceomarginata]|nr:hypothetical protein B0H14DRAFT_3152608 [Mycena olivaceomarginata]
MIVESALSSVLGTSGMASANSAAGYVSVLDFSGYVHVISTVNTKPFPPVRTEFNMSMIQQGLSADVSCKYQQLNVNTQPSVTREVHTVNIEQNGFAILYSVVSVSTLCADGQRSYTAVIIDGNGMYDRPNGASVVCTVTPQTLDYVVSYSNQFIYGNLQDKPMNPQITPAPPGVSYLAAYCLSRVFLYGQSGIRNVVGDSMASIFTGQSKGSSLSETALWEAYIRGVVKFVGTAVKTDMSWAGGPFGGNPPSTMTRAISGTALTTSLGWDYREAGSAAILIPSTFVAVASILIVLFAQYRNHGIPTQHANFDPNDPLLLMAAASAGGMHETFQGLEEREIKEGALKKVRLGPIDNRDGFVQIV